MKNENSEYIQIANDVFQLKILLFLKLYIILATKIYALDTFTYQLISNNGESMEAMKEYGTLKSYISK